STNTGRASARSTTLPVATQDSGVVMTSSPAPIPASASAISMPPVAELTVRTGRPPKSADSCDSNSRTLGPLVIHPERNTSATAAMVGSSIVGRVKGRNSPLLMAPRPRLCAARHEPDADQDHGDSGHARAAQVLVEQPPGRECIDDVAE